MRTNVAKIPYRGVGCAHQKSVKSNCQRWAQPTLPQSRRIDLG
jgi:hypothetical protein